MSSAVRSEQWSEVRWASRLIPGSAATARQRKRPQAVDVDERPRGQTTALTEGQAASGSSVARELLLPNPISAIGGRKLGVSVVSDAAVTVASWVVIAVIATALAGAVARGTGSAHAALLWLQVWLQAERAMGFALVFAAIVTLMGYSEGLYDEGLCRPESAHEWILTKCVAWAALIVGTAGVLLGSTLVPLPWFAAGTALNFLALKGRREWHPDMPRTPARTINVLIVGAGDEGRTVARFLEQHPEQGRVVRGFLDDQIARGFGILGRVRDLASIARREFADEVIVALTDQREAVDEAVATARIHHLDVRIIPEFWGLRPEARWIENWGELPVITVHRERLPREALILKRSLDIAVGGLALLVGWPLLAAIALVIRLDSRGPALYRAARAGRKGQRFECLKFRTMVQNADAAKDRLRNRNEREGPCFKIAHDPRITRVGKFLRRYSLDELPQLWNVLQGQMSLVGPRPHPVDDYARYSLEHLRRLDVTPGLTGLWQVTARQDPSFERNLALDLDYIERWSLGLDVRILWQTLAVVVRGTGA